LKTFPTSFLKQLKTINYFGVDKNLIFIIGDIDVAPDNMGIEEE